MKPITKIASLMLSSALAICSLSMPIAASFSPTSEESEISAPNLTISANVDSELKLPLSLDSSSPVFYCNANLSPGDTATSNVIIENVSDTPIKVSITNIENMLPDDDKAKMLLDILELKIVLNDEVYYQGKHSELSAPFMPYVEIAPHKSTILNVSMKFPREADNKYQGAKYKMRWEFNAMADPIPETTPAPPETTVTIPEEVKTGVESPEHTSAKYGFLSMAVASAVSSCIIFSKQKRNSHK